MGLILKGIEIEGFKSYVEKQYIQLSDLSVLLGANSSGKSTALQALLVIKQTMECNSPDEELLLSGKYVALGDFGDVISDKEKESFTLSVELEHPEVSEIDKNEGVYKISWKFKCGTDGTSSVLECLSIANEKIRVQFRRADNGLHHIYINNERIAISAAINNLLLSNYVLHFDSDLNKHATKMLNDISRAVIKEKATTLSPNNPVCIDGYESFFYRLYARFHNSYSKSQGIQHKAKTLSEEFCGLLDKYISLETPKYSAIYRKIPDEICVRILKELFSQVKDLSVIERILMENKEYLSQYEKSHKGIDEYEGKKIINRNLFTYYDADAQTNKDLDQFIHALDFYSSFKQKIMSSLFFVGPIRENPKGLYNIGFETTPKYVGPTGSYFASVLLHENKRKRKFVLPNRKEECTLSEAMAEWMTHLNVASGVYVDKNNSFGFSVSVENMEQVKSDIMNVGIGTSQVLPVLITVLLSEPGETLVFEQPELHLHPYSQSRLADLFVAFCKEGRYIILETHSEYFLLRLRYHIVKEHFSNKKAAVNFFQNKGGTKVSHVSISGFGNIEYPDDFKDETQELLDSIIDATLERKGLS